MPDIYTGEQKERHVTFAYEGLFANRVIQYKIRIFSTILLQKMCFVVQNTTLKQNIKVRSGRIEVKYILKNFGKSNAHRIIR